MTIYRYKQFVLSLYCSIHYVQKSIKITTHIQKAILQNKQKTKSPIVKKQSNQQNQTEDPDNRVI